MRKTFFLCLALLCTMAQGIGAKSIPVMRFVPVAGEETDVPLNTLRKVVFTTDSVVLIAADDGADTPMYKYDYRAILFTESSPQQTANNQEPKADSQKFIRDGQLFIRLDEHVYNIFGNKIK